jgi:hypothetical protein
MNVPHEYGPSRVGHGEAQCKWCHGTNRENAIIAPNHCEARAQAQPAAPSSNEYLRTALEHVRASAQTGTSDAGVVISFAAFQAVREALETATPVATCDTPDFCRNIRGSCKEVPPQVETSAPPTEALAEICALRGELELTVEHLETANSACEAASKRLDEMTAYMHSIRPKADCYDRICQTLGIESDVLGYIEKLRGTVKTNGESRWAEAHRTDDDDIDPNVELNP